MAINVFDSSWLLKGARGVQAQGVDMDAPGLGSAEGLKGLNDKSGLKQLLRSAIPAFNLGNSQDDSPWVGVRRPNAESVDAQGGATGETKADDADADVATLFDNVPKEDREKLAEVVKAKYPGLEDEEGFDKLKGLKGEEWLSMLVELLKENPSLANKMADRAKANAMPKPSATNSGGIPNPGRSTASNQAANNGAGQPTAGQPPRQAAPQSKAASRASDQRLANGLQPNAARGVQEVRKLGFTGSIGGVGARANKSDHPSGNAIDVMTNDDTKMGHKVKNHFIQNAKALGVKYVIYQKTMYSAKNNWQGRGMKDRGGRTANHMDHPHISFHGGPLTGAAMV